MILVTNDPQKDSDVDLDKIRQISSDLTIVVLDDDPTGTQTVYDVPVFTSFELDDLREAFRSKTFFLLTNSRSLDAEPAYELIRGICQRLLIVSREQNKRFVILTRGDSTLRGHFEAETKAVKAGLGLEDLLIVFAPAFFQGGRITKDNIHYVVESNEMTPVASTPFASDKSFGYHSSNLYDYVLEKSTSIVKSEIFDFSIDELCTQSLEALVSKVINETSKKVLIVNATESDHLKKASYVLHLLMNAGRSLVIRCGASMVNAVAGIKEKPTLSGKELKVRKGPGLVVVGSYVPKSTRQLNVLLENSQIKEVELYVPDLMSARSEELIASISEELNNHMAAGHDCVLYTSRELVSGSDGSSSLSLVNMVSQSVIHILNKLNTAPTFMIAKGGITSSDVATRFLRTRRAQVLGQLIDGVPVWSLDHDSKYPGMPYIVFPGNVGDDQALYLAYKKIKE